MHWLLKATLITTLGLWREQKAIKKRRGRKSFSVTEGVKRQGRFKPSSPLSFFSQSNLGVRPFITDPPSVLMGKNTDERGSGKTRKFMKLETQFLIFSRMTTELI